MNHQEQDNCYSDVNDDSSESNKSSFSDCMNENVDTSQTNLENCQTIGDSVKFLDKQRMLIERGNSLLALKMCDYEKALAERDNTIKSLHSVMMNSQHNNYIFTNQNKNIIESVQSVSDTCTHLNTSFTNISENLHRFEGTVDNVNTRRRDIMNIVNRTTNSFKKVVLDISNTIDNALKRVNIEKIRTKQELDVLEKKYSSELNDCKTNLEECTKEINNLKSENNLLLIKLNEANFKLIDEEKTALRLNQCFENDLKEMESKNILLNNQYKSKNIEYDEIQIQNQSLKDELNLMKSSLDGNKIKLNLQLNTIKEQTELLDKLKITEELNDKLKKDNYTLNERNDYLEKINTDLVDDISNNKILENKSHEERENKFKDMCKSYDNLLETQQEKLINLTQKLELQKENENNVQNELIVWKQEVEMHNKTIISLHEELKANSILIPELQSRIDDLNTDLASTYQKLRDSDKEFMLKKNEMEKEKYALENQNKEYFKQIKKLTSNYMKYKSKAKQLHIEIMRLRHHLRPELKKSNHCPVETIEIMSDEEDNNDDVSVIKPNNVSNMDVSVNSVSNNMNQSSNLSLKRNISSPVQLRESRMKTRRMSMNIDVHKTAFPKTTTPKNILEQKIENSLNSSLKSNQSYNKFERSIEHNQSVYNFDMQSSNTPQKENFDVHNKNKNKIYKSYLNTGPYVLNKKKIKSPVISGSRKPAQKISKSSVQKDDWPKPNSPVIFSVPSPELKLGK